MLTFGENFKPSFVCYITGQEVSRGMSAHMLCKMSKEVNKTSRAEYKSLKIKGISKLKTCAALRLGLIQEGSRMEKLPVGGSQETNVLESR